MPAVSVAIHHHPTEGASGLAAAVVAALDDAGYRATAHPHDEHTVTGIDVDGLTVRLPAMSSSTEGLLVAAIVQAAAFTHRRTLRLVL